MKNVIHYKKQFLAVLVLCLLVFTLSSATTYHTKAPENASELIGEREIYEELLGTVANTPNTMRMMVTSVSVKRKGNKEHAFTSYGTSKLINQGGSLRCALEGITTDYSDRNNFNGSKTIEHVYLSFKNNRFVLKVRLQTWGNETVILSNPKLVKGRQGYFATGNYANGSRTFHYTVAIYEDAGPSVNLTSFPK